MSREFKIRLLLEYGRNEGVGHYASRAIEEHYTDIAQTHHAPLDEPVQGTCLIVFTMSYFAGGHTRVAERWIETDRTRRYSVAFTAERIDELPDRLKHAVETSGGSIIFVNRGDEVSTGLELRKVASRFESVVLFSHMDDVTPLIAFGTEEFKSPVGFYNHADHRFWLGVSVSDLVGELRDWGADFSRKYRGVTRQTMIGVPCESEPIQDIGKRAARRYLGLDEKGPIVTCVGRYGKMVPANGVNMLDTVKQLLDFDDELTFLMVGIRQDQIPGWNEAVHKYSGRLKCYAEVPHDKLKYYHLASDVVLDSRPMGGIAGLADALRCNRPILSCMNEVEWVEKSSALCADDAEMVLKAKALLRENEESRSLVARSQSAVMERLAGSTAFKSNIESFFDILSKCSHRVHRFSERSTPCLPIDRFYMSRKQQGYYSHFCTHAPVWSSFILESAWRRMKSVIAQATRGGGGMSRLLIGLTFAVLTAWRCIAMQHNETFPLVSICIPAYNHERYVQETIRSVIDQDYPRIELIVIDDGSKDTTWKKIEELRPACEKRFERVVLKTRDNRGRVATCREMTSLVRGEFFGDIASDDRYLPGAITALVNAAMEDENVGCVVGVNRIMDGAGRQCYWDERRNIVYDDRKAQYTTFDAFIAGYSKVDFSSSAFGSYTELAKHNHIPNGRLWRMCFVRQIPMYDDKAPLEDLWMNLQMAKVAKFKHIEDETFAYRWHGANTVTQTEYMNRIAQQTLFHEMECLEKRADGERWKDDFVAAHPEFVKEVWGMNLILRRRIGLTRIRTWKHIQYVLHTNAHRILATPKMKIAT